jgi:ATP:ADP antiporter, AAA family
MRSRRREVIRLTDVVLLVVPYTAVKGIGQDYGPALAQKALVPALTAAGFGALAAAPTLGAVAVFQVLRRAGDYAIARPSREVLFIVLPREDRYKSKSFINTFVYRLGDQLDAWSVAGLLSGIGIGTGTVALVVIPLALLWLINSLWLGRRQETLARAPAE